MIITRGFGLNQLIIVRGFGISEAVAEVIVPSVPIVLSALYRQRYPRDIDLRQELLDFLTKTYDEIDLREELVIELTLDSISDISLRDELIEFFTLKAEMPEVNLRAELKDFYEDAGQFEINLREELHELMNREQFEIDLRKEFEEFLT